MKIDDRARAIGIDYDRQVDESVLGSGYYCLCGCGEVTSYTRGRWSHFRPGHDARLVGILLRKAREGSIDINEAIRVLEQVLDTDRLANKLRSRWLRVS